MYDINRIITLDLENVSYGFDSEAKYVTTEFINKFAANTFSGYEGTYLK